MQQQNPESQWFGFQQVDPSNKTGLVRQVFDNVAVNYDVMNDAMSLGIHRLWKDSFVRMVRPRPGYTLIDLAGGTGDIAFRMHKKTSGLANITVCDINNEMLQVGRDRAMDKGLSGRLEWVTGNAESLPFPNNHADRITISFGLRNVTHIDAALAEIHRVLKPGGQFFCLEFSNVDNPVLSKIYDQYSFHILPRLGQLIANDKESYQYLVESIRQFPKREELCNRISAVGFASVTARPLSHGIAAIHCATKA